MKDICFTTNWNKKLDCDAFTTIRLSSDVYQVGQEYNIRQRNTSKGTFVIKKKTTITIEQINETMAYLDTGYSREKTIQIIKKMYHSREPDWSTQKIDYIVLVKKDRL